MHVRGLFLSLLFLPGGARRSIRIDGFHQGAKQQNNTLANSIYALAEAREELYPVGMRFPHRASPPAGAAEPREGPRRAKVSLQAASLPEEGLAARDALIVTDGMDSFYGAGEVFQYLHDSGVFASITAFSSSVTRAKKMLLTREARYSGLLDKLHLAEGGAAELPKAFDEATVWVAVNADEHKLLEQVTAAGRSGVKRAFIHLAAPRTPTVDIGALTKALNTSGMEYTLMRTGELVKDGIGSALILSDIDLPSCDKVPRKDVFGFLAEALTLEEAVGRAFSLCPARDPSQIKEMRRGLSRREEVEALLQGKITEQAVQVDKEAAQKKQQEEEAEAAQKKQQEEEDRTEYLKQLLKAARVRAEETRELMAKEEEEKQKKYKLIEEKFRMVRIAGEKEDDGKTSLTTSKEPADETTASPPEGDDDDGGLLIPR